jgi:hypothetical protein
MTAAELAPDSVAFGLEKAKLLARLDKKADAQAELKRVLALKALDPGDPERHEEAKRLLATP